MFTLVRAAYSCFSRSEWLLFLIEMILVVSHIFYRCQHNQALLYLTDLSTTVSDVDFCLCLRLVSSHQVSAHATGSACIAVGLFLLLVCLNSVWRHAGSGVFCTADSYRQSLKTFLFCTASMFSTLLVCYKNVLYKFTLTLPSVL